LTFFVNIGRDFNRFNTPHLLMDDKIYMYFFTSILFILIDLFF